MAAEEEVAVFEKLPNFRQAGGRGLTNKRGQRVRDGLIYRSSKTDHITAKDKSLFLQLGIKSIIDIRGERQYKKLTSRPLDDLYTPAVITDKGPRDLKEHGDASLGRRYLFDMFTRELINHIRDKVHIFITILAVIFLLPIDKIFGTNLIPRLFCRLVVYNQPLYEQYVDFLEYSKPIYRDMLKLLLSHEENLPVLVHCVYGKDRTGLLVALVLDCIGVDREIIANDYADSEVSQKNFKSSRRAC